ncbi:MAG: MurR/RpiR family transcriptional regulator [Lachnospiraceae bacterium]|nr:MurR/RpiR family transcriptional regulator [Lachnospiraceae bacterium]
MKDNNSKHLVNLGIPDLINAKYGKMSKSQKKVADFILEHYDRAAFMTAEQIGTETGVSESTVVRFASSLGYQGFSEFQKELAQWMQGRIGVSGRVNSKYSDCESGEIVKGILTMDARNILDSLDVFPFDSMENAVTILNEAKTVYVVGLRSCAPLAEFLAFYLNMLRGNIVLIKTTNVSEIFEQMIHVSEEDAVVGISFPRYSLRTLRALEFANERRARIITITDSSFSPLNMYSTCNLWAKSDMISIVDSLTAPLSVINALLVCFSMKNKDKISENLKRLEETWNNYQTYENDEILGIDGDALE